MRKTRKPISRLEKNRRLVARALWVILIVELIFVALLAGYFYYVLPRSKPKQVPNVVSIKEHVNRVIKTGKIISEEPVGVFSADAVQRLVVQTNKHFDSPITTEVTKQTFVFNSSDGQSDNVPIYARVYVPAGANKKPVLAFAPGTTGVGDSCSASLEDPAKNDWGNYDSLLMAYASQGYVVVAIDYEGMRDATRLHHYMVGELAGKAVLDSIRSLKNLALSKDQIDDTKVFSAGYSEGGHGAYWADQIKDDYAPEINLKAAIGFGPVTSVEETLDDATNGANINWFGPLILTSYGDWYKATYPVDKILLPKWAKTYQTGSQAICLDMFNKTWPNNIGDNRSNQVYTPEFIRVAKNLNIAADAAYAGLSADLVKNIVGSKKTDRPKLINHGIHDDVILLSQSQHGLERMCASGNAVTFKKYDTSPYAIQGYNQSGRVDHYQVMNASFKDTISWMQNILSSKPVSNNCK
ncbi:hypothetical protein EXS66_00065 [Candidatus Saccharibacteria bacterium]|nr:hypothetical protein [Candidatus Saccharibacteria bacterium]